MNEALTAFGSDDYAVWEAYREGRKKEIPPAKGIDGVKRRYREDKIDDAEAERRRVGVAQREVRREEDLGRVVCDDLEHCEYSLPSLNQFK